jgi:phosphinothricin acetyltransferase
MGKGAGGVRLRAATAGDAPAVATLYGWHVLNGFGSFEEAPPPAEEMARRMAAIAERGLPWLLAEAEGRVIGYGYAGPYRDRSAYRFSVEDSVYVAPEAQGRGAGRALLLALIERCTALGKRRMIASIGDSGNLASIRLHAACGFRECGRLHGVGFKRERWLDVVWMERDLA